MKDLIKRIFSRKFYLLVKERIFSNKIFLLAKFVKNFGRDPLEQKKISANSKNITVVYLIQFPEVWNSVKSVYYAGVNKGVKSHVLCIPKPIRKDHDIPIFEYGQNEAYDFCEMNGIECIRADLGREDWFDINNLNPDYIIYNRPYMEDYPDLYKYNHLKHKYKLCYIPYAYTMTEGDLFYRTFNYHFIRNMYFIFVPNKSRLELCKDKFYWYDKFEYCQFLFLGFPRFDLISNDFDDSNRLVVLWLPRWTVEKGISGQKESHFLKYYKQFIEYANENHNIHLIIRPHPLMFTNFVEKGIMSEEEVRVFKEICRTSINIELDESKDYLPTIKKAGILVADYTSLLAEFFVTGNPIIYCDDVKGLNKEATIMDSTFYHADSFDQIKEQIEMILNNQDVLADSRREICKEIMPVNAGSIGVEIMNVILKDYSKIK